MNNNKDFENYLREKASQGLSSRTKEAMTYSLMNGGKRVRPLILFSLLKDYGLDEVVGYPCACAIEMIHTYSLIHDDLPCMDDDDLRRGKPSCHKAYNEATAVLAGDALLTRAFQVVLDSKCSSDKKCKLISYISEYAGIDGMIYGQDLDMKAETLTNPSFEDLKEIEVYKTAKLLTLPMICAAILADKDQDIEVFKEIGLHLGIQFQVQDDILDFTSTSEILGKSTSDAQNNKLTAISLLGLDKSYELVKELDQQIQELLSTLSIPTTSFQEVLNFLMHRSN